MPSESTDNIHVAVRVRPFNQREIDRGARYIVEMPDPHSTLLKNPQTGAVERSFKFDFSFWSHNVHDTSYASQRIVFDAMGQSILENAWKGYNATLMAYGQTGSGKSYSMVGYGADKGIIPICCEEMFSRIRRDTSTDVKFKVEASMLEIYNEQVRDLFNPGTVKTGGLKVRENPKTGPYVEDLSVIPVSDYQGIEQLMDEGNKARTIAATNMNATSSRAHTVFQIIFTQTLIHRGKGTASDKVSRINLVDLAGSERSSATGTSGDRLKEGCAINKSLTALGSCISALAETQGKKRRMHVPYRDSVLTWLLKESLGGNAKTALIAAISPADINFEETLSTLRYADRAKQIKNTAIVNEDPNQKLIRELSDEVNRLREQLRAGGPQREGTSLEEVAALKEQLAESEKLVHDIQMSWDEKLQKAHEIEGSRKKALMENGLNVSALGALVDLDVQKVPHLVNLNEDPLMSESLVYFIKEGSTKIGRKDADEKIDIILSGINVAKVHALLENHEGHVTIHAMGKARTFVNGVLLPPEDPKRELHQSDRIIIGNNHLFRFNHPVEAAERRKAMPVEQNEEDELARVIDWTFAQKELAVAQGISFFGQEGKNMLKEMEEKMQKMEEAMEQERKESERRMEEERTKMMEQAERATGAEREDLRTKMEELEQRETELQEALEQQRQRAVADAQRKMRRKRERNFIEDKLVRIIPMITEANAISDELRENKFFEVKLVTRFGDANKFTGDDFREQKSTEIAIKVSNIDDGTSVMWSEEKFMNRIYLIREAYMNYQECDGDYAMDRESESNPFYDPPEDQLIGKAYVYLNSLGFLVEIEEHTPIVDYKGNQEGELRVELYPRAFNEQNTEIEFIENPSELLGCTMKVLVKLPYARGLPIKYANGVFVRFLFPEDTESCETLRSDRKTINPQWHYEKELTFVVTDELLKLLDSSAVTFEVWGMGDTAAGILDTLSSRSTRMDMRLGPAMLDKGKGRDMTVPHPVPTPLERQMSQFKTPEGIPPLQKHFSRATVEQLMQWSKNELAEALCSIRLENQTYMMIKEECKSGQQHALWEKAATSAALQQMRKENESLRSHMSAIMKAMNSLNTELERYGARGRYAEIFGLPEEEGSMKRFFCKKGREPGFLFIGSHHVCFNDWACSSDERTVLDIRAIESVRQKKVGFFGRALQLVIKMKAGQEFSFAAIKRERASSISPYDLLLANASMLGVNLHAS